jgi:hypothetical protein
VLACPGGSLGEASLHVRRHGERDRVDRREELVEVLISGRAVAAGQLARGRLIAPPDGGELDLLGGGERGRVRYPRPVTGPGQAEPKWLDGDGDPPFRR